VGGVADVVGPGTGLLVESGDEEQLASALSRLAADRELRLAMGARAREHVRARYDSRRLLSDMDHLYTELLTARARGGS
jgi:glycosyltransferase involved in cell wall biosynthesis